MKAKEQARKESEYISLSELDMDDIGFSGPLISKDNVFSDDTEQEPVSSPEVKRVVSASHSLQENEVLPE